MSDETLAAEATPHPRLGRKGGKFPTTRGRPANTAARTARQVESDEFLDEDGRPLTRRTLEQSTDNKFDIPKKYKKPGWDYEYKTSSVLGQPVDGSEITDLYDAGWRPVRPHEMEDLCPPGWSKNTIERRGQTLYKRPLRFTVDAKKELLAKAERQKHEKLQSALAGPADEGLHSKRHVVELKIDGEVGSTAS